LKLGAFSDIHGDAGKWKRIYELAEEHSVDVLLCAGDATPVKKEGSTPLLVIYGNHDDTDEIKREKLWLKDGVNKYCGLTIYAINGNYAKKARERHHKDPFSLLALFRTCKVTSVDLAVTHEPPHGVLWRKGRYESPCSKMVTDFIAKLSPETWFYGHSYIHNPLQTVDGTRTVNVDKRFAVFDLQNNSNKILELG